jgi:hypothetical protein
LQRFTRLSSAASAVLETTSTRGCIAPGSAVC